MRDESNPLCAEARMQFFPRAPAMAECTPGELLHELQLRLTDLNLQNANLRRIRTELELSRDRYADLYDFAPLAYLTISCDGLILEANLPCAALLGVERDKLPGQRLDQFLANEDVQRWHDFFLHMMQGAGQKSCELALARSDGAIRYARLDCRHADKNALPSLRIVFSDITERRKSDQELIALNNQLTLEVAQRTADLSALTAQVQQVAEAEKASIARELHDELGSTLVGISMELGRLGGNIAAPELLRDLSDIRELVANASRITRGVINQLYPTVLDNSGLGAAIEWLAKEFTKHSGIDVELHLPEQQIDMENTFSLAAYRITQECLTNIAKHAAASRVDIEVRCRDGFLDLTVHDNGRGLPDGIKTGRHGIFGMIERARYLGGAMEVGSRDGNGTTAHLCLPLASIRAKHRKKVLVVDDHAIVRDALRQLLDSQTDDFSVEGEAADGKAAIQMAVEGAWDIVLLDISLPKKNGIKVLEEIKTAKSELPVIMLSSHALEEYGQIALDKGASGYVEKGETSKLVETMRRAIMHQ